MGFVASQIIKSFNDLGAVKEGERQNMRARYLNSFEGLEDPEWPLPDNYVRISILPEGDQHEEYVIVPRSVYNALEQGQTYQWHDLKAIFASKDPDDLDAGHVDDMNRDVTRILICESAPKLNNS